MTNNDAVTADELRITVEMGDDFTPSPELQIALDNLRAVLEDESDDVSGFAYDLNPNDLSVVGSPVRSFSFSLNFETIKIGYTENDSKGKKVI